jgi:VWFA-related protein
LLSDGDDNLSHVLPMDVVNLAKRMNVSIYTISVNSIEGGLSRSTRGDGVLQLFAQETGGIAAFPKRAKELSGYFAQISEELRSQYAIGYRSTNAQRDGGYRKIRIDPKDTRYLVHSRAGYYAPIEGGARPDLSAYRIPADR